MFESLLAVASQHHPGLIIATFLSLAIFGGTVMMVVGRFVLDLGHLIVQHRSNQELEPIELLANSKNMEDLIEVLNNKDVEEIIIKRRKNK